MAAEERGWKRVESETSVVNPQKMRDFAAKHNGLPQSPTERTLVPDRVEKLKEVVAHGRAIPFCWATVKFQGKTYRMNGQHSSRALVEYEGDLPDGMAIHLDKYEASTKEGMADLFRQFDARWSQRSKADVSGAFQGLVEAVAAVPKDKAKMAVEGVAWQRRNVDKVPVPPGDEAFQLFFEEALYPFVVWVGDILSIKTPEMKRAPVVGAMYATFCASETGSREFWRQVAVNNVSDDSDPSAVLSRELVDAKEQRKPVAPGIYYAKCVKAWNAFREGNKITRGLSVNVKDKGWPAIAA